MKHDEKWAPVAAAISALATMACCLPLGIAGAIGALGLSVALETMRPWLMSLAVLLLGWGLFELWHGRRSCQRRSPFSLILFGVSIVVVVGVLLFPQTVAELMASLPHGGQ